MITNANAEMLGAIAVGAVFAGIIAYLVQWCWDYWQYLSSRGDELYFSSIELVEADDADETLPEPILTNDELQIGDVAYDHTTSYIVTYCGKDEDGNSVCVKNDTDSVFVYRCDSKNLSKVAE